MQKTCLSFYILSVQTETSNPESYYIDYLNINLF